MRLLMLFLLGGITIFSCNTSRSPLFGKRSRHDQYSASITQAHLQQSFLGKAWLEAAGQALVSPQRVVLPYSETGFFSADKPAATGLAFAAVNGEKIVVQLSGNPDTVQTFLELWRRGKTKRSLVDDIDSLPGKIMYTVSENDSFLIRLQPELLADLEYTLSIFIEPSLAFPVSESGKPRLISFWGNDRDGGARRHEGVDIAAKFRTPVLAATRGIVSRVNENKLGGKVVFLRDEVTGNHLYYAHLDSQIAVPGQGVKTGDTIGLIGNTGNARNTVPHLHFGIYTFGGAIDPLPFINPETTKPPLVTASLAPLHAFASTVKAASLQALPSRKSPRLQNVEKGAPVWILAATGEWYKVKLVSGETGFIESQLLKQRVLRSLSLPRQVALKLQPGPDSPTKKTLLPGEEIEVLGIYQKYYLVNAKGTRGWVERDM